MSMGHYWNSNLQGEKAAEVPLYPPLSQMEYFGTEPEPLWCEAIN
jgi:hypothetical protein